METIITFIISGIAFYVGFIFGKKEVKPKEIEKTAEDADKERQKKIDASFQKLFEYNETIATRGYRE